MPPQDISVILDDANIRSTSAAFDPANIGKPSLLGAGLPTMDSELLKLLAAYGGAAGMGSALWARQAHQQQPGM